MTLVYKFEPKERAYIQEVRDELMRRLTCIAQINHVKGNVNISPDGDGFIDMDGIEQDKG